MHSVRTVLTACLFLIAVPGSLLLLSGCGKDTGEGGVKVGGAVADPDVEARDKAAAAETAAAKKP